MRALIYRGRPRVEAGREKYLLNLLGKRPLNLSQIQRLVFLDHCLKGLTLYRFTLWHSGPYSGELNSNILRLIEEEKIKQTYNSRKYWLDQDSSVHFYEDLIRHQTLFSLVWQGFNFSTDNIGKEIALSPHTKALAEEVVQRLGVRPRFNWRWFLSLLN